MISNKTQLAFTVGSRVYNFLADADSPLNEAKEALFQFIKFIGQIEDAAKAAAAKAAADAVQPSAEPVAPQPEQAEEPQKA